ncbi:hypothetical protein U9M48_044116 [Paspalum notatum var. saurae]|uniref:Uncharacterized protein n=1 Tax=Paspalum notatum var. saurae TaxID=547442 RepID=A0AAQ3UUW6_PASNO
MEIVVMVLLTVMAGLFGATSAVLGFIAESKRLTADEIHVSGRECVYPHNAAPTLGLCAILLLLVAQIIASMAGGCCGCCCRSGGGASKSGRRVIGVIFAVLAWVAAVIAAANYLIAAQLSAPRSREATFSGDEVECYALRAGVFTRAAVLSLVATAFGIMSCIFLREPAASGAAEANKPDDLVGQHPPEDGGVAIGLPQWPAQGYEPQPPYAHPAQG